MRTRILAAVFLLVAAADGRAYVEVPYTLGRTCAESSNIVLVEVTRVNKEKNLILYKKVQDLKGEHNEAVIKHNIGKGGFHEREWKNIMAWAEPGKRAVFFHNGSGSETCFGTYWYQAERSGDWWTMTHAEPFMLRTYYGEVERLAAAVSAVVANKEVVVTCLADGNKEQLHLRKGKVQRLKASLKRQEYDAKRDFVGFGGDGADLLEYKTFTLVTASTPGWKFLPAASVKAKDWNRPAFDDKAWRDGKAPIGYGEDEIANRKGTTIAEQGVPFVFRRAVEVPADLLAHKGVTFRMCVASDDSAIVYLNGEEIDKDPEEDHEFQYWNRDVEVAAKHFKPGRNVLAVYVKNRMGSSDLYLDLELSAEVPVPKAVVKKPPPTGTDPGTAPVVGTGEGARPWLKAPGKGGPGTELVVQKDKRTVIVPCAIAPRKLPTLAAVYPIEVVATYPTPRGQKAHETVVIFENVRPSDVHKALESIGLKPGQPARGEDGKAVGPELKLSLEFTGADGKAHRIAMDKSLVNQVKGQAVPALTWHFTGSAMRQPDPEKDEKVFGADLTGTLIALFPVTDDVVIQSNLTLKDEPVLKLETDAKVLPKEGAPARLIIEAK